MKNKNNNFLYFISSFYNLLHVYKWIDTGEIFHINLKISGNLFLHFFPHPCFHLFPILGAFPLLMPLNVPVQSVFLVTFQRANGALEVFKFLMDTVYMLQQTSNFLSTFWTDDSIVNVTVTFGNVLLQLS